MRRLTGGGDRYAHWSLEQFLRVGKWAPKVKAAPPALTVLDLFGYEPADPTLIVHEPEDKTVEGPVTPLETDQGLTTLSGSPGSRDTVSDALTILHERTEAQSETSDQGKEILPGLDDHLLDPSITPEKQGPAITGIRLESLDRCGHDHADPDKAVEKRVEERKLGVDLAARGHEVAKLLYAGFGRRIHAAGYDPEDVLQEVYKGILTRNRGKCPWDSRKSSFGHYVYMVCGCILSNYHRKASRRRSREQVGLPTYVNGEWKVGDAAESALADQVGADKLGFELEQVEISEAAADLLEHIARSPRAESREAQLACEILPLKSAGFSRTEIAHFIGVSPSMVSRGLAFLRDRARDWSGRV